MHSAVLPSQLSYPSLPLASQPVHQRLVRPGPLVLRTASLNPPTPTTDTDRTVSRRSEPSSRTALTGEQPDPWDLLQPQDAMSRHRGAKPIRRYELLESISLLSLAYLLSVERRQFHIQPSDHLGLLSHLLDLLVLQLTGLIPIRSCTWLQTMLSPASRSSVTFWEEAAPAKLTRRQCPSPGYTGIEVRILIHKEWCFTFQLCPDRDRDFNASHLRYAS